MGSTSDKIKGTANEAAGKAKKAAGDLTDNSRLKAEGAGQRQRAKPKRQSVRRKTPSSKL